MNKELEEAIFMLEKRVVGSDYYEGISEYVEIILNYLVPPTAEEVCSGINGHFWEEVEYRPKEKAFYVIFHDGVETSEEKVVYLVDNRNTMVEGCVAIKFSANPQTYELIAKFYKGVKE